LIGRLHKALYSCAIDIIEGAKPDELVNFCMRRIEMMQRHRIRVVMVFDGGPLPMKLNIEDAREKYMI
jgi:exonuclease-1